jgi:FtsZ-binding cell division protein ZapB
MADDLHQAIQAATTALCDQDPAIGLSDPWAQVARIAVETAAPPLLQAIRDRLAKAENEIAADEEVIGILGLDLQELRDRYAALEVHAAELRDLLEQLEWAGSGAPEATAAWDCCPVCGLLRQEPAGGFHLDDCKLAHALQAAGPARGHAILDEVERLREENRQLQIAYDRASAPPDTALDQAAPREVGR